LVVKGDDHVEIGAIFLDLGDEDAATFVKGGLGSLADL